MKTFIFFTLCLLATLGFGNAYVPYQEYAPFDTTSNDTCSSTASTAWISAIQQGLSLFSLGDRLLTNPEDLIWFAEDYGHIIHRAPKAAFVPRSTEEIAAFVRLAVMLNLNPTTRFQIVIRGGGGNVQGATQTDCDDENNHQVLLDMSALTSVRASHNHIWAESGASWLQVVEAAAAKNLRPTVIPDHLGITVGGFLSTGGFGGDSVADGPSVDQVQEVEVVTPLGEVVKARPGSLYYRAVRGGMGSFGIITRAKLAVRANNAWTRTYHILTGDFHAYIETMKSLIRNQVPSQIDYIQSFVVPNQELFLSIFVAPQNELDAVRESVDRVLQRNQTWAYYIEIVFRADDLAQAPTSSQVGSWLTEGMDPNLVFFADAPTPVWDNRLKLFVIPALVQQGTWGIKHPWGVFSFPDTSVNTFETILNNFDPFLDAGFGLIAVYPFATNSFQTDSFLSVPRSSEFFFLVTFGRNELTGTDAGLQYQAQGNRNIWNQLTSVGEAGILPTVYMPDFGPSDWEHHFGSADWQMFRRTKLTLDPLYIFADQRNFGFDSLYNN